MGGESLGKACALTPCQQAGQYDMDTWGVPGWRSPRRDAGRPDGCRRGRKGLSPGAAGLGRRLVVWVCFQLCREPGVSGGPSTLPAENCPGSLLDVTFTLHADMCSHCPVHPGSRGTESESTAIATAPGALPRAPTSPGVPGPPDSAGRDLNTPLEKPLLGSRRIFTFSLFPLFFFLSFFF